MQGYNLIVLYDRSCEHILMCKRRKDPYLGLYNLIGGKIEPDENHLDAAYRELQEESGVDKSDVDLIHLMDFTYYLQDCYVEVYAGRLKQDVSVFGDENDLFWSGLNHDFFDMAFYAGEGNIGHIIEQVNMYADKVLK